MKFYRFFAYLTAAAALWSCSGGASDEGKAIVAVSVEPQAAIVEALAGDDFTTVTVLDRGANPENFEPGMSVRMAIDRAEAYFTAGGLLPFEKSLTASLADSVRVYDSASGIEPAYGTHGHSHDEDEETGHHHHEGGADPHVWSSLVNIAVMTDNIAQALGELRPDQAGKYSMRADSLLERLDTLDASYRRRLAEAPSQSFAVWHPSLSYFARDYDLRQIAIGQEHKEISAMRLKELVDSAAAGGVRVFFFQREFDSRQAETANERIGSRLVTINPLSRDWEAQMNLLVDELTRK